jgi:MFS family permease
LSGLGRSGRGEQASVDSSKGAPTRSRKGLIGLLAGNAVSLSGTRLSMIALPWFVITTTGSALHTGLAAFSHAAPYVVAKALAGPLVDRLGPRRVIVAGELAGAVAIGTIALLGVVGTLPFGVLLVLVALVGAASGPADGGKSALIPDVADMARVPLERVTGLLGTIERLATTVGSAAAGGLVALLGPIPALGVNAATFVGAASIIAVTAPRRPAAQAGSYVAELKAGAEFIWSDRLLRSIFAMVAVTNLLDAAWFGLLLPVWAHETGRGPAQIGLIGAVLGGAAVVASMLAAVVGHRMPRRATYLVSFLIAGAPRFVVLAMDVSLGAVIGVHVVSGFASGFLNPILGAVILGRIPRPLVGRVTALGSSLAWAGIPFGGLAGGALIAAVGLTPALLVFGAAYLVTTTLPGLQSGWREMDRRANGPRGRAASGGETEAGVLGPETLGSPQISRSASSRNRSGTPPPESSTDA